MNSVQQSGSPEDNRRLRHARRSRSGRRGRAVLDVPRCLGWILASRPEPHAETGRSRRPLPLRPAQRDRRRGCARSQRPRIPEPAIGTSLETRHPEPSPSNKLAVVRAASWISLRQETALRATVSQGQSERSVASPLEIPILSAGDEFRQGPVWQVVWTRKNHTAEIREKPVYAAIRRPAPRLVQPAAACPAPNRDRCHRAADWEAGYNRPRPCDKVPRRRLD
jgi:hypothetical protein